MGNTDMFDPFDERSKKLLRQARNRRHYQKKKRYVPQYTTSCPDSTADIPYSLRDVQARLAQRHAAITGLDPSYECVVSRLLWTSPSDFRSISNSTRLRFRPMGPLFAPKKLPCKFEAAIAALNRRMLAWGYVDDQRDFVAQSERELEKVRPSPRLLAKWVRAQDNWLLEGHALLGDMEKLMATSISMDLNAGEVRELWRNITDAAFRMQWMIVGIEFTIGTIDMD